MPRVRVLGEKTHKVTRGADNKPQFDWDGRWEWKHFLVSSPAN